METLTDFRPIYHELDGRNIRVFCVSDVHIGAKECDLQGFKKLLQSIEKNPDWYLVLCGDIINNNTRSCVADIFSETMTPREEIREAVRLLEPVKDRILGVVSGNHELRSRRECALDPMGIICANLGIESLWRPEMAFLRVVMRSGRVTDCYSLLLAHGASTSRTKRLALSLEGIDAYIVGHTHEPKVEKSSRIVFTEKGNVTVKSFYTITACSWLKYGGYAAEKQYTATATSCPQSIELEWTNSNNRRGELSVIW